MTYEIKAEKDVKVFFGAFIITKNGMKRFLQILLFVALVPLAATSAPVSLSETHANVSCFGGSNGSINLTPADGAAPYTFLWSDDSTSQNRNNLSAGNYFVTVTDNSGGTASLAISITQPLAISVSKNITNVFCGGDSTGAIDLTVLGGTAPYTFLWNDGATAEDRVNLTAANRYFTITDTNGCTKFDSANVTQPPGMVISKTVTSQTCSGANGAIDLTVQYGIPGYFYLWNDSATTQDRTGIYAGNYSVTITDNSGCTVSASATVGTTVTPMSINSTSTNPSCHGGNNGTITITSIIGSSAPYTFLWSDDSTSQNRNNLSAGNYSVTVTSSATCTASASFTLSEPTAIKDSLKTIPISCNGGSNGIINTTVSGGTAPYNFAWSDGGFTQNRTGLSSATYTVTISDLKDCIRIDSIFVSQPLLALSVTAIPSPLACTGGPSGSVVSSVSGGTQPYYYWWGGGFIAPNRLNVPSGTYCVTVTDSNGCIATACAIIPPYTPMSTSATHTNINCFGGTAGSIDLTVTNGTTPYHYSWNTSDTTQDISNLSQGTYTVTVTDNNTCTTSRSVTVSQPSFPLSANTTIANVSCYGRNDGSITLNPYNGTAPYSYSWNNGNDSASVTGLSPATYHVTITDNNGCSITDSTEITQPTPLLVSLAPVNVLCFGDSSGAINLFATGSFAPYSYAWSDSGEKVQNRTHLPAGNYSVLLVDNHGCTATASTVINQPSAAMEVTATKGFVSCNGGNDGFIDNIVAGGTAPYTFLWNDGDTSQNRNNLSAGIYSVTVTDSVGCVKVPYYYIAEPPPVFVSETVTNVACSGGNTGAIALAVSGGIPSYTYGWDSGYVSQNIANLFAGTYIVTITDAAGCSKIDTAVVAQSTMLNVSASSTDVICNGGNNGTINISVNGGTLPYNFLWSDDSTSQNRNNIPAGNYSVSVTDVNNCSAVSSSTITEPAAILISTSITNPKCFNSSDGKIDLNVSGGAGNFSYSWNDSDTLQNRNNLSPGNYFVTVNDASGCSASSSATLNNPAPILVSETHTNVSCSGSGGNISLTVSGGTAPYNLSWSNSDSTQNISSLIAGNYYVTVSDANACSATDSATINNPNPISISETHTNVSCNGMNNGTAQITVNGGNAPYTFLWSDDSTSQNRNNLSAGNYFVTANDNAGCSATVSVNIASPLPLLLALNKTDAACNGANGSVSASVSGGTPSYFYSWDTTSTDSAISVAAGNYSVTVTDANACTVSSSVIVNEPNAISIILSKNDISCFGNANGNIFSSVSGGTGSYIFHWSNSDSTQNISALAAGNYSVTVSDVNSCSAAAAEIINEPNPISIAETHANISCNGMNNGTIATTISGGTAPYVFHWSNADSAQNISALAANTYVVSVTDANSCSATKNILITEPAAISLSETHLPFACSANKGSINLSANGGTAPYNFHWSNSDSTQNISSLIAGNYSVSVNDANGCSSSLSVNIIALPPLSSSLAKTDLTCSGANNGSINLLVNGGTNPYSYQWTNGATTQNIFALAAGNYAVIITDANHCTTSDSAIISQPNSAQITDSVIAVKCFGDSTGAVNILVSGGNAPYSFAWSNSFSTQNISSLRAGIYALTVTDANGCKTYSTNFNVTQPQRLSVLQNVTPVSCTGRSNGEIDLTVNGGVAPYSYSWNNQAATNSLSKLSNGNYFVTVTDANGCTASVSQTIGFAPPLEISSSQKNTACEQSQNGSIDVNVSGGTPPYIFDWNNGNNTEDVAHLAAGNYSVSVTDSRDCSVEENFNIAAEYELQVDATESTEIHAGESVQLNVTSNVNYGNAYSWSPDYDLSCANCVSTLATPKETTFFTVNVIDTNGCKAMDTLTITVKSITDIFIPNAFTPNHDGNNDVLELYGDKSSITFIDFMVFDRWGEKVYEASDPNFAWDGMYKGEIVPQGVYVYVMKLVFINGYSRDDYKGSITVLR